MTNTTLVNFLQAYPDLLVELGIIIVPEKLIWTCAHCEVYGRKPSANCNFTGCERFTRGDKIPPQIFCGNVFVDIENNDCAGSALLLVRCMKWLHEKHQALHYLTALSAYDSGWSLGWWNGNTGDYETNTIAQSMVEAALLAVLDYYQRNRNVS